MKNLIKNIIRVWVQAKWLKRIDKELQKADKFYRKYKSQRAYTDHLWIKYSEIFKDERSENAE